MATFTMQSSTYISCKVDFWEERISPQTSRIHADAYYRRTNNWSGITYSNPMNAWITIHGETRQIYGGYYQLYAADGWKHVGGWYKDISHGDAINVGVSYSCDSYGGYFNCSGSGSIYCAAFYSAPTGVSGTMLTQDAPQRGRAYSRVNVGGWGNNSSKSWWVISRTNNRNPVSEWAASSSSNTMYWGGLPSNQVVTWYAEAYNNHGYATFAGPYRLSALSTPSATAVGGTSTPQVTLSSSVTYRGGTSGSTTEDKSELRSWRLYYKRADQAWSATESPQQIQSGSDLAKSVTFSPISRSTFDTGYNYHISITPVNSYGAWGDTSNLSGGVRILRCPQNVRASNIDTEVPEQALFTLAAGQAGGFAGESESAGYTNGSMWGYQIEYSTNSDLSGSTTSSLTKGSKINLTGLELNTVYYYRVKGYNSYGLSNVSAIGSFKTREEFDPQGVTITNFDYDGTFRYKNLTFSLGTEILYAGGLEIDAEEIASTKLLARPWEGFYNQDHEWVDPYWGTIAEDTSGSKTVNFSYTMSDVLSSFGYAYNRPNPRINGSTSQQTYSGKNLLDAKFSDGSNNGISWTVNNDGSIKINGTATVGVFIRPVSWSMPQDWVGRTLTMSIGNANSNVNFGFKGSGNQFIVAYGNSQATRTITQDNVDLATDCSIYIRQGATLSNYTIFPMVEAGSTATSYEPYVGGVPSPNPDYPQEVQNTIIGNIELCQIGDYQDYAYYSEGKWYKHSEIGKQTLTGTESFQNNNDGVFQVAMPVSTTGNYGNGLSNCFTNEKKYPVNYGGFGYRGDGTSIAIKFSSNVLSEFVSFITALKPDFYFPLATPTDTEITDTETLNELNRWLEEGWITYFSGIDFRIVWTNTRGRQHIIEGQMTPPTNVRASAYKRYQNRPLQFVTNAAATDAGKYSFTTDDGSVSTLTPKPMAWLFAANVDAPSTVGTVYSDQLSVTGLLSKISTGRPGDSIDYNSTYNGVVALTSEFGLQTRSSEFELKTGPRTEWFLVDEFRPEGVPLKTGWRLATTSTITSYPIETYYVRADALGSLDHADLRNMRLEFWTKPMYFREENVGLATFSKNTGSKTWLIGYLQDPADLNFKFGIWSLPSGSTAWQLETCFFDGENWLMDHYDFPDEAGWDIGNWTVRTASGGTDGANGLRSSPLATTRVYPVPLGEN